MRSITLMGGRCRGFDGLDVTGRSRQRRTHLSPGLRRTTIEALNSVHRDLTLMWAGKG